MWWRERQIEVVSGSMKYLIDIFIRNGYIYIENVDFIIIEKYWK